MTLRPPEDIVAARPDGAVAFAGDEGNLMLQDGAKAVFRGGVTADTGDFDVYQHDLVGDGDLIIPLDDFYIDAVFLQFQRTSKPNRPSPDN